MLTNASILSFINGAIMMIMLVAALLFARSYRDTRDRFFLIFSVAFCLLSVERVAILFSGQPLETNAYIYLIRCVAFAFITYAIVDKNRA